MITLCSASERASEVGDVMREWAKEKKTAKE